jgi:hypothetical protein
MMLYCLDYSCSEGAHTLSCHVELKKECYELEDYVIVTISHDVIDMMSL